MCNERKSRHPLKLLKLYSLFLSGASDEYLLHSGVSGILEVSQAELSKIKQFNNLVSQNKKLLTLVSETGINQVTAKRMMQMHESHIRGEPVSHCAKRTQMTKAFTLLLDGLEDDEILDRGVSVSDLDSAKLFLGTIPDIEKMLLSTVAQKFEISRHAVARMLRIYRDSQAEGTIEEMNDNGIPIPLTA